METNNETVADIVKELRDDADAVFSDWHDGEYWTNIEAGEIYYSIANRIEAAHRRDREAARRRAERSAIYNMMESFPRDWDCNPGAVRKWMTAWYTHADELCEGGPYAEQ